MKKTVSKTTMRNTNKSDSKENNPSNVKLVAFYLPQFHTIPENDDWWGKGFTEWTSVKKAKPLFNGHKQPKEPGELGYYDLTDPTIMKKQVKLAIKHGINGFCFYHYWFNGKKLLEKPVEEFLKNKELKINFCLCWANDSWRKNWYNSSKDLLLAQEYGTKEDWIKHFNYLLPFLKDERSIKIDGKPIILIHKIGGFIKENLAPNDNKFAEERFVPELLLNEIIKCWREEAEKNSLKGIYIVGGIIQTAIVDTTFERKREIIKKFDFDAVYELSPFVLTFDVHKGTLANPPLVNPHLPPTELLANYGPLKMDYDETCEKSINYPNLFPTQFKGMFVSWDNTPRHLKQGMISCGSTPEKYGSYLKQLIQKSLKETIDKRLIFINSWNEWSEGAYLEPDKENGTKYLEATKKALKENTSKDNLVNKKTGLSEKYAQTEIDGTIINHQKNSTDKFIENYSENEEEKNCLVICHELPKPDMLGSNKRLISILNVIKEKYEITILCPLGFENHFLEKYKSLYSRLGIKILFDDVRNVILKNKYDLIIFEWWIPGFGTIEWVRRNQSKAVIVVDAVDVCFVREQTMDDIGQMDSQIVADNRKKELAVYNQADAVIIVSKEDGETLRKNGVNCPFFLISLIEPIYLRKTKERQKNILFVGNYGQNRANVDAVLWFTKEILPLVIKAVPDANLTLVGSQMIPKIEALGNIPGISVVGFVPTVEPYLDSAAVFIAPLRYGAGIKVKVCQAMANGVPVIATKFGAQGLNAISGRDMIIANDAQEFAKRLIILLKDSKKAEKIGKNGQQLISGLCSLEVIEKNIQKFINWIEKQTKELFYPLKIKHLPSNKNSQKMILPQKVQKYIDSPPIEQNHEKNILNIKTTNTTQILISKVPTLLCVELTNLCNLKCDMCPHKVMQRPSGHMNLDLFKKIVDDSKASGFPIHWFHFFGEPLLYPHLEEALIYFKKNGLGDGAISTNGLVLNDKIIQIITNHCKKIRVSIDSAKEEYYKTLRRNNNFNALCKKIRQLISASKGKDIIIEIQYLRTIINPHEKKEDFEKLFGTQENVVYFLKDAINYPDSNDYRLKKERYDVSKCPSLSTQLLIGQDGNCTLCCFDYDIKQSVGNANTQALEEIWFGQKATEMRKNLIEKNFEFLPTCKNCPGPD